MIAIKQSKRLGAIFIFLFMASEAWATSNEHKNIRELLIGQKTAEAMAFIRQNEKKVMRTDRDRQQLVDWLSVFYKENTLNYYEKAMEKMKMEPQEAKKLLLSALQEEPYNKLVLTTTIAFLIQLNELEQAREKIDFAEKEMNFLSVYKLYARYLQFDEKKPKEKWAASTSCEKNEFNFYEKEFCLYLMLLEKAAQQNISSKELVKISNRLRVPNKHLVLWRTTKDPAYRKKYLLACQGLSDKDRKNYGIIPSVCTTEGNDLNVDKSE